MTFWKGLVALLAASLMFGLAAVPASAADGGTKATAAATKKGPSTRKLNRDIRKVRSRTTRAERRIRGINTAIGALRSLSNGNKQGVDFLLAAAPQLVSGLTQLRDGSLQLRDGLVAAGEGLKKLQAALETQIGPGLQAAGTAIRSTEYGIGQVLVGGQPLPGAFLVTPDVPDAAQQAQTSQDFVVPPSESAAPGSSAGPIDVVVGVRSAESDGTGDDNPAAACRVTIDGSDVANGAQGVGNFTTSRANPALGGAPFYGIPTKSPQTSTAEENKGFPFGPKSDDVLVNLTTAENSAGDATAVVAEPFSVNLSCIDTTPSATDPSA
jgi:X-X-X-Leu-X-X-Gly heptad repeat protein